MDDLTKDVNNHAGAESVLNAGLERRFIQHADHFRFIQRPIQYNWIHKANLLPGDIDCTDMDEHEFEKLVRSNAPAQGPERSEGPAGATS